MTRKNDRTRRRHRRAARLSFLTALFAVCLGSAALAAEPPRAITIFAAASTTDALGQAIERFEARSSLRVKAVYAASSTLAKQVARGAPADLVLLANPEWMDYLVAEGAIAADSRVDLLGNRLAVIAPAENGPTPGNGPLAERLAAGYLAIGDPAHVPAGVYAKTALTSLGLWESVAGRTLRAANVRAALALVERGEAATGIVYRSDAEAFAGRVRTIAEIPPDSHPPVIYPLALVSPPSPAGEAFQRFLTGAEAAAVFRDHGFAPLGWN